ncbi:MAG: protein translocase subunit SecF, partial [Nocardioidaceae bacterium]
LGSGALKDLALALFVGMAAGAYSSIFIATPLLVQLKEREPGIKKGDARARTRARHHADRYAAVPVFTDDMAVQDEPGREPEHAEDSDAAPVGARRSPRSTAGERPASRPVSQSASSKRAQPSRKPRSQRGKR